MKKPIECVLAPIVSLSICLPIYGNSVYAIIVHQMYTTSAFAINGLKRFAIDFLIMYTCVQFGTKLDTFIMYIYTLHVIHFSYKKR